MDAKPIVLHQHFENELVVELATRGVPENVSLVHAWWLQIFDPQTQKEFAKVQGVAEYVAPDPDASVKGYGRLTFTLSPEICSGSLFGVAEYKVAAVNVAGVGRFRFGGGITFSRGPRLVVS